jgi:hypothetical protein
MNERTNNEKVKIDRGRFVRPSLAFTFALFVRSFVHSFISWSSEAGRFPSLQSPRLRRMIGVPAYFSFAGRLRAVDELLQHRAHDR